MDQLWLAYLALAVGLMGFGALWGWLGIRRSAEALPRGPRLVALLFLLLAAGGTVAAVILGGGRRVPGRGSPRSTLSAGLGAAGA
jgi:hypothetical protein